MGDLKQKMIKELETKIEAMYGKYYHVKDNAQRLAMEAQQEKGTAKMYERDISEAEEILAALKEEEE